MESSYHWHSSLSLLCRGWHIIIIAPLAVVIVATFSGMNIMETMFGPYMKGFVNYAGRFYLIFLAGSVFGKFMEDSQAARSIANGILKVTGKENPMRVMLAIALSCRCVSPMAASAFLLLFSPSSRLLGPFSRSWTCHGTFSWRPLYSGRHPSP